MLLRISGVSVLLLLIGTAPAWAARTSKTANPVYSATDSDANELPADGEVQASPPTPVMPLVQVNVSNTEAPARLPAPRVKSAQTVYIEKGAYDPVPSDQVDSIANRLKLTLEILVKSHRAYDYRVHTTRDLETILARLEAPAQSP